MPTQHIGDRIRRLRKERGMSAEKLAGKLNRGSQTVFQWEWGKTSPRYDDLLEIARVLRIDISELTSPAPTGADSSPPPAA
jgi:repressor LexA